MVTEIPMSVCMVFRIIVACVLGGAVGFERTKRLKEAGIRTHCIIAAAAALLMLVSTYGFTALSDSSGSFLNGIRGADPARIAAQVVSGISFLGAGVIFKNGNSVKGLTTAAGIWATAAIGLAIGAGMYVLGIAGTVVIVAVQLVFHRFSIGNDAFSENDMQITVVDSPEFRAMLDDMLEKKYIQIVTMRIDRKKDGVSVYTAVLRTRRDFSVRDALDLFDRIPGVKNVSM